MTASSPRPAGSACPVGRVVYGDRPCEGPGTYYCDGDLWGSACHRYYEAKREGPAAPDTTGGELREQIAEIVYNRDTFAGDLHWSRTHPAAEESS